MRWQCERVTTKVIGYFVPGANRDSPNSRLPSSPLFVSPASQLSPPMSNSWYDTLTSTPALIATALGVSVAALFVSTHAPNNNSNNSKTAAQVKEQIKEVAQSVHAEGSKGKMAQAVRRCVAARMHGYTGNGQRATGDGADEICRVHRSCLLRRQISLLPR